MHSIRFATLIRTFLIVAATSAWTAELTLEEKVGKLVEGDTAVVEELLEHGEEGVEALIHRVFMDTDEVEGWLEDLGAETYARREQATLALMAAGREVLAQVETHILEHGEDPEVRMRGKRILDSIQSWKGEVSRVAVITYLNELESVEAKHLFRFTGWYMEAFESKPSAFFPEKRGDATGPLIAFTRQFVRFPGGIDRMMEWLKDEDAHWRYKDVYPVLVEALVEVPDEHLLKKLSEAPMHTDLLTQIVDARPDLETAMREQIRSFMSTMTSIRRFDEYTALLMKRFGVVFEEGELDGDWRRLLDESGGKGGVLHWRAKRLRIRHDTVLKSLIHYQDQIGSRDTFFLPCILYVLETQETDLRAQALDLFLQKLPAWTLSDDEGVNVLKAVLTPAEAASRPLAEKTLEVVKNIQLKESETVSPYKIPDDTLVAGGRAFFMAHAEWLLPEWRDGDLNDMQVFLLSLWSIDAESGSRYGDELKEVIALRLPRVKERPGPLTHVLLAGWALEIDLPMWDEAMVYFVHRSQPGDLRFWCRVLGGRHQRLLPLLLKGQEEEIVDVNRFAAALMIQPEDPLLQSRALAFLRGNAPHEKKGLVFTALTDLHQEPDLTGWTDAQLEVLFPIDTAEAYKTTCELLKRVDQVENQNRLLQYLEPELGRLLEINTNHTPLNRLGYVSRESWEIAGDTLLTLMDGESETVRRRAAGMITGMDFVHPEGLEDFHSRLQKEKDGSTVDSLLWVLARLGPRDGELARTIRALPLTTERTAERVSFALANISPDEEERDTHFRALLDIYESKHDHWKLRMIGLTRWRDEEVRAYLADVLDRTRLDAVDADTDKRIPGSYEAREVVFRLSKRISEEDGSQLFKELLSDIAEGEFGIAVSRKIADGILIRLPQIYPDRLSEFTPLLEALPLWIQFDENFRRTLEASKQR